MVLTDEKLDSRGREMLQQKTHWFFVCSEEEAAMRLTRMAILLLDYIDDEDFLVGLTPFCIAKTGMTGVIRSLFIKKSCVPIGLLKKAMTLSGVAGYLPNEEQDIVIVGFTEVANNTSAEFADRMLRGKMEYQDIQFN